MSAHSPGLWEISPIEDSGSGEIVVWDYDAAGEVEGSTIIVPVIYLDDDQSIADANLLVAAKDLFNALEAAIADYDQIAAAPDEMDLDWVDDARAAIAKAKGVKS